MASPPLSITPDSFSSWPSVIDGPLIRMLRSIDQTYRPTQRGRGERARVGVLSADSVGVSDVLGAASLVLSEPALQALTRRAARPARQNGA